MTYSEKSPGPGPNPPEMPNENGGRPAFSGVLIANLSFSAVVLLLVLAPLAYGLIPHWGMRLTPKESGKFVHAYTRCIPFAVLLATPVALSLYGLRRPSHGYPCAIVGSYALIFSYGGWFLVTPGGENWIGWFLIGVLACTPCYAMGLIMLVVAIRRKAKTCLDGTGPKVAYHVVPVVLFSIVVWLLVFVLLARKLQIQ
jgi:hypothetical protein